MVLGGHGVRDTLYHWWVGMKAMALWVGSGMQARLPAGRAQHGLSGHVAVAAFSMGHGRHARQRVLRRRNEGGVCGW